MNSQTEAVSTLKAGKTPAEIVAGVRRHSAAELALIYRQSEIAVNVGRGDYRQDANVRTFEAMAAGALLVTSLPSELSAVGFQDGAHFVGYGSETEIPGLVRAYLADEAARRRIAEAGRELVLREHTYDRRVDALLAFINDMEKKSCSPARVWTEERVRLAIWIISQATGRLNARPRNYRQSRGTDW